MHIYECFIASYMLFGIRIVLMYFTGLMEYELFYWSLHDMLKMYCLHAFFVVFYLLVLGQKWPNKYVQTKLYNGCNYPSMLRFKLKHAWKGAPWMVQSNSVDRWVFKSQQHSPATTTVLIILARRTAVHCEAQSPWNFSEQLPVSSGWARLRTAPMFTTLKHVCNLATN